MKKSKSMTKIQALDFSKWENIIALLGGFLSYYFGFYEDYKKAINSFNCISTSAEKFKATLTTSIGKMNSSIGGVTANC
jgi:hypothetical protein